jgi:hypothetical protein
MMPMASHIPELIRISLDNKAFAVKNQWILIVGHGF